jgi:hypothetical protein
LLWFQEFKNHLVFRILRNQLGVLELKGKRNFFQGLRSQYFPAETMRIIRLKSSSFPSKFITTYCEVFFVELNCELEICFSVVFTSHIDQITWSFQILVVNEAKFPPWAYFCFFDFRLWNRDWLLIFDDDYSCKNLSFDYDFSSFLCWHWRLWIIIADNKINYA